MIKHVIFDIGGVLKNASNAPVAEWVSKQAFAQLPAVYQTMTIREFFKTVMMQTANHQNWDKNTLPMRAVMETLHQEQHIPMAVLAEMFSPRGLSMLNQYEPKMFDLVRELKRAGKSTFILSNMPLEMVDLLRTKITPDLFDDIIYSCEIKMVKPDREIFEYAIQRFNIDPRESLFIDDSPKNLLTAQAVGLHTYLFDNTDVPKAIQELRALIG